jgi:hypothetical protein
MNTLAMVVIENPPQFFVGWGTLMLINAGLAQSKNRSGLAWFLLSLLLGPLATFILVLLEKKPMKLPTSAPPSPSAAA